MTITKNIKYFFVGCLLLGSLSVQAQDIPGFTKQEIKDLAQEVEEQVRFLQYLLNTVGSEESLARDKDVIIRESYKKIFRDDNVQVEDDLLLDRKVITNKNVTAYFKDVEFFFKDVSFQFKVKEIKPKLNDKGELFFEVAMDRTLSGTGINGEPIENTKNRFVEVNFDQKSKELKIASMYTTRLSRDEELTEWWSTLSYEWGNYFRERFGILEEDSVTVDDLYRISGIDSLDLSGNPLIIDLSPIEALNELKYIDISHTNIRELAPISNVTFLSYLDISNTPTEEIQFIKYSDRLTHLNLSHTGIKDIDDLLNLKNLVDLRLANTSLLGFGVLNQFVALENLDLEASGFNNIENINGLKRLKSLNLKDNFLINFGFLSELTALEDINLEGTNILDLSPLAELKELWKININGTEVSSLAALNGSVNIRRIYADRSTISEQSADEFARRNRRILLIHNVENLQTWWETLPEGWNKALSDLFPSMNFQNPSIEELSELVGIDSLNLSGSEVTNLRPALKFKKAFFLSIDQTRVADLTPLVEMKTLTTLSANQTPVAGLEPLGGLAALERLFLKGTKVTNIDPIKELVNLRYVDIDATEVAAWDAESLATILPNATIVYRTEELHSWWESLDNHWQDILKSQFEISETPTSAQLHAMTAQDGVRIEDSEVLNLEPLLVFFNLIHLSIHNAPLQDISALTRMENLGSLRMSQVPVKDLIPLSGLLFLEELDLSNTGVEDLRPIAGLSRLKKLVLSGTNISRLRGLETLYDLRELDIASTNVKSIKPIMHLINLERLVCFNTRLNQRAIDNLKEANPTCEVRYY
ncbi:leucine-rich repeat domain-containing protein [Lunatimonas salinarum]|uniref:leucine-rich repeat domain-containing protein n=1 Tax=Lunatimonas salinarum TaxID=1774590 RepID=UPI001AE09C52|nr:leucine-rich repeat domain-containing protein [Lunatimonas salinarum]